VRARLIAEHGIVTTAAGIERAPLEMTTPVLRVSPHVDAYTEDIEAFVTALRAVT
jgi:pyridoxal 5-phosphate dependent beta-lyase